MVCSLCYFSCVTLKMDKIYYQSNYLWKGQKAIAKLRKLSKEKPKVIKQWLSKQAFWQMHLPAPKCIILNEIHQFNLLYMPSGTLYGNKHKYILAGIYVTSRYKVARPLRTKQAKDVAEMIADIYKVDKILAERLFKVQDAQQLSDPKKVSATWVKHLYGFVDKVNNTISQMIGMKPSDAIKLSQVSLVKQENYPPENKLPDDGLYWYLLQPSEEHNDQRCRATNKIWSKKTQRLREVMEEPGN